MLVAFWGWEPGLWVTFSTWVKSSLRTAWLWRVEWESSGNRFLSQQYHAYLYQGSPNVQDLRAQLWYWVSFGPLSGQSIFSVSVWLDLCCCCWVASGVWLFVTVWTVDCQAPLSMGFSRQEYWIGLPFPPPGVLPDPGIGWTFTTAENVRVVGQSAASPWADQ